MTVTSTLMSGQKVLAAWDGNAQVAGYFAAYAEAFECNGDSVELLVTREMVDQMIAEVEDFLTGLDYSQSDAWLSPLAADDVVLVYRETLAV